MGIFPRANVSNQNTDALQVICGFPLSEPYQLMPRVVLYPLLVAAFWSRTALVIVMLWTSVAAIHVSAMAKTHSYSALDLDMFPAYMQTVLGLLFGASYIQLSRGLKEARRVDMLAACLWLILLWTGMVSFVSTTRYQPASMPCLGPHCHNITTRALLSQCAFQCHNVTTTHPMRFGQTATLIPAPGAFYTGRGKTDSYVIFWTVLMAGFILLPFWMATKTSMREYTRQQIRKAKNKQSKDGAAKIFITAPKVSLWGFIILVWIAEDCFKHLPPHEGKATISQWGPLAALAVAFAGFLTRCLLSADIATDSSNPNKTQDQKAQNAAAMGPTGPHDIEMGNTSTLNTAATQPQPPATAHIANSGPGTPRPPADGTIQQQSTETSVNT